jgi:TolB protein
MASTPYIVRLFCIFEKKKVAFLCIMDINITDFICVYVSSKTLLNYKTSGGSKPMKKVTIQTAIILISAVLFVSLFAISEDSSTKLTGTIIFCSNRSGPWRIWTVNPDGTNLKELISNPNPDENDVDPVFSKDKKKILFTSTRGGKVGIWQYNVDGGTLERICDGDQAEYSPDETRICFRKNDKIFVRELKSGKEKQIVPDSFKYCSGPVWSPDGKTIAFACRWDAGNGLYIVDAEGGEPKKVYDQKGACGACWSPDGKLLVYETETHVCTIQPDGQKNRLITYWGGVQRYPRYSPDGQYIVYSQGVSEKGPWELYIVPATGGQPKRITEGGSDMYPDWR